MQVNVWIIIQGYNTRHALDANQGKRIQMKWISLLSDLYYEITNAVLMYGMWL